MTVSAMLAWRGSMIAGAPSSASEPSTVKRQPEQPLGGAFERVCPPALQREIAGEKALPACAAARRETVSYPQPAAADDADRFAPQVSEHECAASQRAACGSAKGNEPAKGREQRQRERGERRQREVKRHRNETATVTHAQCVTPERGCHRPMRTVNVSTTSIPIVPSRSSPVRLQRRCRCSRTDDPQASRAARRPRTCA